MSLRQSIRFVASASLLAVAAAGHAEDPKFTTSAELRGWAQWSDPVATDLVPDAKAAGYDARQSGADFLLRGQLEFSRLTLKTQLRLQYNGSPAEDSRGYVDEAYGELRLGQNTFLQAGRRILSYGQSYGLNPSDIFHDPLRENRVFRNSVASEMTEGTDMVGLEVLFNSGHSLSLIYAPDFAPHDDGGTEDFPVLRFGGTGANGALDYSFSAMGGERPGMGIALTYGIGDSSVLYLDGTLRRGRDRQALEGVTPSGNLIVSERETSGYFPYVTAGFGYTFGDGISLNAELTHDAAGYSDAEWDRYMEVLDAVTPVRSAAQGASLGQINGLLDHYTLRRNYGFLRLAKDGMLNGALDGEVTLLHGFDDDSGTLALRLEHPIGDKIVSGLNLTHPYGHENGEFVLRPRQDTIALYTTMKF